LAAVLIGQAVCIPGATFSAHRIIGGAILEAVKNILASIKTIGFFIVTLTLLSPDSLFGSDPLATTGPVELVFI